jgi:hypothetical protein
MTILIMYWALSVFCWAYALRYGGLTGLWAFALFLAAMGGTYLATSLLGGQELWIGTNAPLFITDIGYFLGLYALALRSRKYWPIWSAGFQLMCLISHFGPLVDHYSNPALYRALESFWMMPIMVIMVLGIAKDRQAAGLGERTFYGKPVEH